MSEDCTRCGTGYHLGFEYENSLSGMCWPCCTAAVDEFITTEVDLAPDDLEVVHGCAAAHPDRRGGQHVAMQCSGVLVVHKPTGIAVRVLDERSQIKNKSRAVSLLRQLVAWNKLAAELVAQAE